MDYGVLLLDLVEKKKERSERAGNIMAIKIKVGSC